jgi:ubiquitin carboxyl-terminal hydrolase L3
MMSSSLKTTQAYRKHFIPLESNPEVFTELVHKLGVSESLEFQDVLSLDDADILAFLPRPVHALILVFPTTDTYEERVREKDSCLEQYLGNAVDGDVLFFKQTINNACGLYAVLHAVCNGGATAELSMCLTS